MSAGIRPLQRLVVTHEPRNALLPAVEQGGDFTGTGGGQLLAIDRAGQRLLGRQVPDVQRRYCLIIDAQDFFAPLGLDGQERHRVVAIFFPEQKRPAPRLARLGTVEYMVHGTDHAMARTEVGAQGMQAASGGLTGAQVGVDVGAAEGVDRLLRVADQEQTAVGAVVFNAVDALEDPVLHRVGVLEFVDQRHRELLADQGRQALAAIALQRRIQAQQHVVEAHFRATALFFFEARTDPMGGVLQHGGIGRRQAIETGLEPGHRVQARMIRRCALLPGFCHAVGGQAREAGADVQLFKGLVFGPGFDFLEPGLEIPRLHLAPVDTLAGDTFVTQGQQLVGPLAPGHLEFKQGGSPLLQAFGDQLRRLFTGEGVALAGEQPADSRQQGRRPAPIAAHPVQRIALHRITEQPPVIAQDFTEQIAVVGFQGLGKQAAAVEGVLAQHALAPTVDGRHRRLIHPLRGDVQAIGAAGPLLGRVLFPQLG